MTEIEAVELSVVVVGDYVFWRCICGHIDAAEKNDVPAIFSCSDCKQAIVRDGNTLKTAQDVA